MKRALLLVITLSLVLPFAATPGRRAPAMRSPSTAMNTASRTSLADA